MIEEEVSYDIVCKPRIEPVSTIISYFPVEIKEMVEYFQDIVVYDLPSEFPPKRSSSHNIDLIPGASLPNKAAYRMTPKENEEIRNQVHKLLEGEWRMCNDSRAINKITIRHRFPLPMIDDLMDCQSGSKYLGQDLFKEWLTSD